MGPAGVVGCSQQAGRKAVTQSTCGDPLSLKFRLEENSSDPLCAEALARISHLEALCARMTDSGVVLEEDVCSLVKADTWWVPQDTEYCYTNLQEAMQDVALPGDIVEWARAHTLENSWAVWYEEVRDQEDHVVIKEEVREYDTYQQAEEDRADYLLRKRRVEFRL